jgi:hypothetical protein
VRLEANAEMSSIAEMVEILVLLLRLIWRCFARIVDGDRTQIVFHCYRA